MESSASQKRERVASRHPPLLARGKTSIGPPGTRERENGLLDVKSVFRFTPRKGLRHNIPRRPRLVANFDRSSTRNERVLLEDCSVLQLYYIYLGCTCVSPTDGMLHRINNNYCIVPGISVVHNMYKTCTFSTISIPVLRVSSTSGATI